MNIEKFNPEKIIGVTKTEKEIIVYLEKDDGMINCYDGNQETEITKQQLKAYQKNNYDCPNRYIEAEKRIKKDGKFVDVTIKEYYDYFIEIADDLKKATKGKINLRRTGDFPTTAYHLFLSDLYPKMKDPKFVPEPFDKEQSVWIHESMIGALIYAEEYQGEGYKADFVSMYPSIMASQYQLFPIKNGKFETIEEISKEGFQGHAIYRCKITPSKNKHTDKLFRFNKHNKYTEQDITAAEKLGLKVELLNDGEPNKLYFDRSCCLTGSQLFGNFVKFLYDLKEKKVKGAKLILNCLHGRIYMKKKWVITVMDDGPDFPIHEDKECIDMEILEDRTIITLVPKTGMFVSEFARIYPFLVSRSRFKMMMEIKDHADKIVWLHTDGIISKEKLDLKYGTKLGELRYEGYCENCFVKNCINKSPDKDFKL